MFFRFKVMNWNIRKSVLSLITCGTAVAIHLVYIMFYTLKYPKECQIKNKMYVIVRYVLSCVWTFLKDCFLSNINDNTKCKTVHVKCFNLVNVTRTSPNLPFFLLSLSIFKKTKWRVLIGLIYHCFRLNVAKKKNEKNNFVLNHWHNKISDILLFTC